MCQDRCSRSGAKWRHLHGAHAAAWAEPPWWQRGRFLPAAAGALDVEEIATGAAAVEGLPPRAVRGSVGRRGEEAGALLGLHPSASDGQGTIYTAGAQRGRLAKKFRFTGMGPRD